MSQHPLPDNLHIETLAVRAAVDRSQYGENSEAMYLTSGYVQPDAETAARRFAGEEDGYTYARLGNPTVSSFEMRLAALEGAEACIATSTGMSAILLMCLGLLKSGDHVICSHSLFGSTIKLIGSEFAKFGVQTSYVSQTNVAEWKAAMQPNTRLLFAETPTNPLTEVCDIRMLADIAHAGGAVLASAGPFRPAFGVEITSLRTELTYDPPAEGRPALPRSVTTRLRGTAFWLKSLDDDMTITFTDYVRASRPIAGGER